MACNGLQGYINAMADECQALHDSSIASKLTVWLEPLVKVTELISPIASLAGTATGTPLPTEIVLGGVRGVLNITKSIPNVQKPAIQLESQIGRKQTCCLYMLGHYNGMNMRSKKLLSWSIAISRYSAVMSIDFSEKERRMLLGTSLRRRRCRSRTNSVQTLRIMSGSLRMISKLSSRQEPLCIS